MTLPVRRGHALARARGHVDHDAGLVAIFGRRRARDDLHRLNRIQGNLVGEDLALLVGDGLAIDRERVLRVIAQSVEKAVGIGGDSRRRQRHQRTHRRRLALQRHLVEQFLDPRRCERWKSFSSRSSPAPSTVTVSDEPFICRVMLTFTGTIDRTSTSWAISSEALARDSQVIGIEGNIRDGEFPRTVRSGGSLKMR